MASKHVIIDYTNHRKERAERIIKPGSIWFGTSEYHDDGEQWFLTAWDTTKEDYRHFAMKDIRSWEQVDGG